MEDEFASLPGQFISGPFRRSVRTEEALNCIDRSCAQQDGVVIGVGIDDCSIADLRAESLAVSHRNYMAAGEIEGCAGANQQDRAA